MTTKTLFLLLFSSAAGTLLPGCGERQTTTPARDPSTRPARAEKPSKMDEAKVARLSQDLAAKVSFGAPEEIERLLQQGASPDATNRYGLPVIFMAAQRGERRVLELLIKAGANVNSQVGTSANYDGLGSNGTADGTPLTYAAGAGKLEAMELLRAAGADVNSTGPEGTSALMRAAEAGRLEAAQWLLRNGSTAGREKAVDICRNVVNPTEPYRQLLRLLQNAPQSARRDSRSR